MEFHLDNPNSKLFLSMALLVQLSFCFAFLLQINIAWQLFGFLYLTFVPGFIIIHLLGINGLDRVSVVLFSAGISLAFLMLSGLLLNQFSSAFGLSQSLSAVPLMVLVNLPILFGEIVLFSKYNNVEKNSTKAENKDSRIPTFQTLTPTILIILVIPILSMVGIFYANIFGNNSILLFALILIPSFFIVGILSKKFLPPSLYPLAVFAIAIAILYQSSLISNHIFPFGSDAAVEYFVAKTTQLAGHWNPNNSLFIGDLAGGKLNSMLSVSMLPALYSNLTNLDLTWVFKLIFPAIFALVPLGLYNLWKEYIGGRYSFIATFLFMSFSVFYNELLGLNRQMIGEVFLVLILIVIFAKNIKSINRVVLFAAFSFGLIVSHYALAEIFFGFLLLFVVLSFVLKKPNRNITPTIVILFLVILLVWYIYTSNSSTFTSLIQLGTTVESQLNQFLNPSSRGQMILSGLGAQSFPSIWNRLGGGIQYLTQLFIVLGLVGLVSKRVKLNFSRNFLMFVLIAAGWLLAIIVVPGFANILNASRFYQLLLFFLAPVFIVGVVFISKLVSKVFKHDIKVLASVLFVVILFSYFLFQTGVVYELAGVDNWSVSVSKNTMNPLRLYGHNGYIDDYSASSAKWISAEVNLGQTRLYSDGISQLYQLVNGRNLLE